MVITYPQVSRITADVHKKQFPRIFEQFETLDSCNLLSRWAVQSVSKFDNLLFCPIPSKYYLSFIALDTKIKYKNRKYFIKNKNK